MTKRMLFTMPFAGLLALASAPALAADATSDRKAPWSTDEARAIAAQAKADAGPCACPCKHGQ